ncbi:FAD dependent oxidoreductase [Plectosphaerella plurivora]|uniref:FAD dependent oxidoreductase n=1 Tax=Plectosphaerella plurivora TaxID=936078 RepID=A0A9P8V2T1_9PEZI|nr:FAD dependent oxidoreductase [Plectosphaerella plurivora]
MASPPVPHPHGMGSFWRESPGNLNDHRTTENLPAEADIVIIGGGFAGAASATHLIDHPTFTESKPSIVVLEARQLCSGATGRNGGHLKPDSYSFISVLAERYGLKAAAEVANFEAANVHAVTDLIRRKKIDCDFVLTRAIDVDMSTAIHRRLKTRLTELANAGVEASKNTYCGSEDHAERLSGVKGAKGMMSFTAGHLWPYKLIHALFSDAVMRGVNLQTHTPATSMTEAGDGSWAIETPRGTIRAKKVIVATNAYTAALLPEYKNKIIPYRGAVAHIKTPGPAPFLPNTYTLRFSNWDFDYLIPRPDGSIIVGGARSAYLHDKQSWYGNVDDSGIIASTRTYFEGYMQRHFHGWENSGAYVVDTWSGIMGYSADRLPRLGPVPGRSGVFIMAGFTGHGMPQVLLCSKGVADMVMSGIAFKDTGIPSLFEESVERLIDPRNLVEEIHTKNFPKANL